MFEAGLLTLRQADTKWCPFARAVYYPENCEEGPPIHVPHNRHGGHPDGSVAVDYCRCVSVDCMMWRWFDPETADLSDDRRGYCGLGGVPIHGLPASG